MKTVLKCDKDAVKLLFQVDDRIPSVNAIYEFNRKTGARYKTRLANKVYQIIQSQITLSGICDFMPEFLQGHSYFKTKYNFILRYSFDSRDLSNMLKLVEDAIHRKLGIDDSKVVELVCAKSVLNNMSHAEFIVFEISPSNFDMNYFENKSKL